MGSCLSKKSSSSGPPKLSSSSPSVLNSFNIALSSSVQPSTVVVPVQDQKPKPSPPPQHDQQLLAEEQAPVAPPKKEVFLIKHRKSHDDRDRNSKLTSSDHDDQSSDNQLPTGVSASGTAPAQIRTSSCTKEELDAILIQCGRLSRSSSGKAASSSATAGGGRRYSGSKRSFDFDNNGVDGSSRSEITAAAEDDEDEEKRARDRERQQRRSRHSPSPQGRRRRTPSREREKDNNNNNSNTNNQRSSSRERRISRSPGRRGNSAAAADSSSDSVLPSARPGKMVSVPATVTDKSNNGEPASGSVKRITVKRNVGDPAAARTKTAASPRTQSPARVAANDCQAVAPSLSRNSSRKAEVSPYRRNPLSEMDPNSLSYPNRSQSRGKREIEGSDDPILVPNQSQKPNSVQRTNTKNNTATVETTVVTETKPQTLTRTRSSRRSRDLDFNPESLLDHTNPNPVPSYTRLLLQDIHNFHQKNTTTAAAPTPVTLPACVSKACSILEAVADLNNNTATTTTTTILATAASSNLDHYNKTYNNLGSGTKDPFVESEIGCCNDLTEPSFHKYVTVRRGAGVVVGEDADDQESSGSNSFIGSSGQISGSWGLSPSSAECWSSKSREEERSSGRKRESSYSGGGIGRGRLGSAAKGLQASTTITTTSVVVVE